MTTLLHAASEAFLSVAAKTQVRFGVYPGIVDLLVMSEVDGPSEAEKTIPQIVARLEGIASAPTVYRCVKTLTDHGVIRVRREGRKKRLVLTEAAREAFAQKFCGA